MKHQHSDFLTFEDSSETWLREVLHHHYIEATERVMALLEDTQRTDHGCLVTATSALRKVKFRGHQTYAYRFVYCVLNRAIAGRDQVVRHRCHNRLCINPKHLEIGSQADNKRDDWEHWAGGTDPDFL